MSSPFNELRFTHGGSSSKNSSVGGVRHHHEPGLDWMLRVNEVNRIEPPVAEALLVGASDEGTFGSLMIPQLLTRLLSFSRFRACGVVSAENQSRGGYASRNYGEGVLELAGSRNLHIVHAGGNELARNLSDGYLAAARDEEKERVESIAGISSPEELQKFVQRRTGQLDDFAYLLAPEGEFYGSHLSFHSVGLSNPDLLDEARKSRLVEVLKMANFVGVRDQVGADFLESQGVDVFRMPCCLSVLPQVGARQLREYRDSDTLNQIRNRFPDGWIAVDISGIQKEYFERLTKALREISDREEIGIVFFESHPSPQTKGRSGKLSRWVRAFEEWQATGLDSTHIWEVASFLLHSRLYCGVSVEARAVCMSGGVARINIPSSSAAARSYCELWEHDDVPIEFSEEEDWATALEEALRVDLSHLQEHATWLHETYFKSLEAYCQACGLVPCLQPGGKETAHSQSALSFHHLQDEWLSDPGSTKLFRRLNRRGKARKPRFGLLARSEKSEHEASK